MNKHKVYKKNKKKKRRKKISGGVERTRRKDIKANKNIDSSPDWIA